MPEAADRLRALGVGAAIGGKFRAQPVHQLVRKTVKALARELLHAGADQRAVSVGDIEEEPLEIRRDQNIHRGGVGTEKVTPPVIDAGLKKVRQDAVGVRRADKPPHRQPQPLGHPARQNVAEVPRRHHIVHLVAGRDPPFTEQLGIGDEIIAQLRRETTDVDRVRARERDPAAKKLFVAGERGKGLLHARLAVVKVAAHGTDRDVFALLRDHLGALDRADAAVGIKDEDARTGNVVKALEGGLAGVAGGRRQHDALASLAALRARRGDELRQHRKRHVLERGCRAAEELQHIVLSDLDKRCKLIRLKFSDIRAAAELVHTVDVRQQMLQQHGLDPERVQRQTAPPVKGVLSERGVDEQPSVRRNPAQDSLRRTG